MFKCCANARLIYMFNFSEKKDAIYEDSTKTIPGKNINISISSIKVLKYVYSWIGFC